jgi:hypothetical protein
MSRKIIVSQRATLCASVPPKLPSIIQESPLVNASTVVNHSSFEGLVQPARQ